MRKILFLPGAAGSPEFWQPVAKLLPDQWDKVFFGWPGLGDQPHDPRISSIDDLVRLVEVTIDGPVDLVAQSIGGVIAARIALNRSTVVRRLVLAVTSAGVNMTQFGASDWRADYRSQFPLAADWIMQRAAVAELAVELIDAPTLLIWGDSDPISPPDPVTTATGIRPAPPRRSARCRRSSRRCPRARAAGPAADASRSSRAGARSPRGRSARPRGGTRWTRPRRSGCP